MRFSLLLHAATPCFAAAASVGAKPQMGWNSWNVFGAKVNQSVVESIANIMAHDGYRQAGYEYVVLDEGWQAKERDASGRQQANAAAFPSGIAALGDYVHKLGLKIGIYSDAGIYDCDFYPGSFGNEELDAATYAAWGIDYLKYDNCGGFMADAQPPQERFLSMAYALAATGRTILYSLCQWGNQFPWFWADQLSNSYRISGDIYASFATDKSGVCQTAYCLNTGYAGVSVLTMIRKMRELSRFQKPGAWADMDMLEIGSGTMTEYEEQTHFAFWAALKSPLVFGTDLRSINASSRDILLNTEIVALSQDDAGVAVNYLPNLSVEGKVQVWAGPLSSGRSRLVVLAFNEGAAAANITIPLSSIPGLPASATHYQVRDVWVAKNLGSVGSFKGKIMLPVASHQTKVLVFSNGP